MIDDIFKSCNTYITLTYFFMPVLMRTERIFTVVKMQGFEPVYTYNTVKLFKNAVKIADDIITAVKNMAGVQTYADFIF